MPDDFHTAFADALRTGRTDPLQPYLAEAGAAGRLSVYRNNVVRGAIEALRAAFPAIDRLIGSRLFDALARAYWHTHPPERPTLILYGDAFADYLAGAEPVAGLPWLADVARHDRAWLEAHHAPGGRPLGAADAAGLAPETLPALVPGLQPSVRLLTSPWPAYDIWHRNRIEPDDAPMRADPGQYFSLLWRQDGTVCSRMLHAGEHAFLDALGGGAPLETAAQAGLAAEPGFDPAAAFAAALSDSLLKGPLT
jgi:hypothetical protein